MSKRIYTTTVDEDGVIIFPDELMNELGWFEGDELSWVVLPDSTVSIVNLTAETRKFALDPNIYPGTPNDPNTEVNQ